jgi:uncharacterized membrane protein YdbT with pleckstrin-like domain
VQPTPPPEQPQAPYPPQAQAPYQPQPQAQPQAPYQPQTAAPGNKKLFHEQFDNEHIILLLRKDVMFLVRRMLIELLVVLGIIAVLSLDVWQDWGLIDKGWFWIVILVILVGAGIVGFIHWFNWRYDLYVVTDRRIVDSTRRFPLNKRLAEAQLDRVQDTSYQKNGLFANVFNYGSITIQTAGEADNFVWDGMPDPVRAQAVVRQAVETHLQQDAQARSSRDGGLR